MFEGKLGCSDCIASTMIQRHMREEQDRADLEAWMKVLLGALSAVE